MDCKTARLFLHFARPRADELEATEAAALDAHLGHCADCANLAGTERRLDQHLGRAVRQVEVPDGLRNRLVARLAADRADWYRRWVGHGVRAVAVAAALLLLVWGAWHYTSRSRLQVDADTAFQHFINGGRLSSPDEVDAYFERLGASTKAPESLNYAYLTHYGRSELPGHAGVTVPRLEFAHEGKRAVVYILSDKQFDLKSLHFDPKQAQGYPSKLRLDESPDKRFAYLIFYNGESDDWLRRKGDASLN
jgi:hypothetical protein